MTKNTGRRSAIHASALSIASLSHVYSRKVKKKNLLASYTDVLGASSHVPFLRTFSGRLLLFKGTNYHWLIVTRKANHMLWRRGNRHSWFITRGVISRWDSQQNIHHISCSQDIQLLRRFSERFLCDSTRVQTVSSRFLPATKKKHTNEKITHLSYIL